MHDGGRPGRRLRHAVAAGAVLAGAVIVAASPASAATSLQASRIIGGSGHADHYGWGADTIPPGQPGAGNVLVTDYWNFRITELDAAGEVVRQIPMATGRAGPPYDVAVNPVNGNIAVGNVDAGARVDIFSRTGTFLRSCGNPSTGRYPAWLDYDPTGRLVVADSAGTASWCSTTPPARWPTASGARASGNAVQHPAGHRLRPRRHAVGQRHQQPPGQPLAPRPHQRHPLRRFPVPGVDNRGLLFNTDDGNVYVVNASDARIDVYTRPPARGPHLRLGGQRAGSSSTAGGASPGPATAPSGWGTCPTSAPSASRRRGRAQRARPPSPAARGWLQPARRGGGAAQRHDRRRRLVQLAGQPARRRRHAPSAFGTASRSTTPAASRPAPPAASSWPTPTARTWCATAPRASACGSPPG